MSADKNRHKPSTKHTLDEVLQALQDLVRTELSDSRPADKPRGAGEPHLADPPKTSTTVSARSRAQPEQTPEAAAARTKEQASRSATNADLSQPSEKPASLEHELPVLTEVVMAPPVQEPAGRRPKAPADQTRPVPEQATINWDDIPVLNEAVKPATAALAGNVRDIACKAVARLNINLRKAGQPPLDPAMIDRLEAALRDTLLGLATDKQEPPRH